jgi:hypothetical protein
MLGHCFLVPKHTPRAAYDVFRISSSTQRRRAHVEFRIDKIRRRGGNIAAVQRPLVQTLHHGIVVPGGLAEAGKGICAGR